MGRPLTAHIDMPTPRRLELMNLTGRIGMPSMKPESRNCRLRIPVRRSTCVWIWIAHCCLISVGCSDRPSAPELRDTPVYQNKQAGFRFLVPDGWNQTANAVLPNGPIQGEVWIARYTLQTPERGATLQILGYEEKLHPNFVEFHAEPSLSVNDWQPSAPAESVTVGGVTGTRMIYSGKLQDRQLTKEVVGFQRSGRMYCFVAAFHVQDDKAREQVRRAINSLLWSA